MCIVLVPKSPGHFEGLSQVDEQISSGVCLATENWGGGADLLITINPHTIRAFHNRHTIDPSQLSKEHMQAYLSDQNQSMGEMNP